MVNSTMDILEIIGFASIVDSQFYKSKIPMKSLGI